MGYRSTVKYIIETEDAPAFLEKFLAQSEYTRENLEGAGNFTVTDKHILLDASWVKWYALRLGVSADYVYREVEASEALVEYAQEHDDVTRGGFARIGEEDDDSEIFYWGEDPYGLIGVQRFIEINC